MTRILLIDDDPDVLATLRTILLAAGFDVTCAASASEAIDRIRDQVPACIVTDIYMPEGDGYELMAALRRQPSPPPVIAISGGDRRLSGHDPLEIAAQLGAAAVLAKPFTRGELVGAINRAIRGDGAQETGDGGIDG